MAERKTVLHETIAINPVPAYIKPTDLRAALNGVDPAVILAEYPQIYVPNCFSKTGCPVFISKPGMVNMAALDCITGVDGIMKYHWHSMMHDFVNCLSARKKRDPDFCR